MFILNGLPFYSITTLKGEYVWIHRANKKKDDFVLIDKNFNKNSVYIVSDDKIWKDILKENQTIHLIKELDGFRIFAPYYFK